MTVLGPAAVLFCVMTAHALLETARDALFLTRLGPDRLAWAYLAIAGVALVAVGAVRRWSGLRDPRRMLIAFLVAAVAGTTVLASVIELAQEAVFALYVWTGLVATVVVPCFWTVLDRSIRVGQAKRHFAAIGAGGVLGALVGSAIASGLGRVVATRYLVTAGALVFGIATVAAIALAPHPLEEPAAVRPVKRTSNRHSRRYLTLLAIAGIVSTIALTIGDLTFKRVLAERLSKDDLATAFGAIYTGLNLLGLVIQLAVTPRLLAKLGVGGALAVLPAILMSTGLGFALTGAWIAILALKLGDGGLRHSLHRVANEILFLAVPAAIRDGAKPAIDALAQRGGQAAAALVVFGASALGLGAKSLAAVTAIAGLAWFIAIPLIRRAYIAQFRDMLRAGEVHREVRVPDLDASSVELLLQALSSPDEIEAIAALDLLASAGGVPPALVLYHPQHSVVKRALAMLEGTAKPHISRVLGHLLAHADPDLRAAALAAANRTGCHRDHLERALDAPDASVRAAALVALAGEETLTAVVGPGIAKLLDGSTTDREALAAAILDAPHERFRGALYDLLAHHEPSVMRPVLRTLAHIPRLAELERLLPLLADPHVRGDVRHVFVASGQRGLDRLIAALDDPRLALEIRQHVPRTISRFHTRAAAAALVARLGREPDGTTEFKILRALGHLRAADPALAIDERAIGAYARRAVADATRFATLAAGLAALPPAPALDLVRDLLAEKQRWAIEHAFRAFGILAPRAALRSVYDAIASEDEARRSAAREIFEHLVAADLREPLLAVIDHEPTGQPFTSPEALFAALLAEPSASLRCLVAYHIAERKLETLRPEILRLRPLAGTTLVQHAFDQAIERLDA